MGKGYPQVFCYLLYRVLEDVCLSPENLMSERFALLSCFYSFTSIHFVGMSFAYFFPWYREEFTLRMCCGEGGKVGLVAAVRGHDSMH